MRFEAVIFDMDGTLTVPALDFVAVRREIGLPSGDIITELAKWSEERRRDAWEVIERHESEAMGSAKLQEGCIELLKKLRRNGVKTAILTRNSRKSVDLLIAKTGLRFDSALTREHDHVKPSPAPVTHILRELNAPPSSALMVGDYIHDLESGRESIKTTHSRHLKPD